MKALLKTILIRQATSLAGILPPNTITSTTRSTSTFLFTKQPSSIPFIASRVSWLSHSRTYSRSSRLSLKLSPEEIIESLGPDRTIASEPFTWEQLKHIVHYGDPTMHSRSMDVQEKYVLHSREIKKEWRSMNDYILCSKFGFDKVKDCDCGWYTSDPSLEQAILDKRQEIVLLLNEFPYFLEENIEHWCLWKLGGKVLQEEVDSAVKDLAMEDVLTWVNPPHLQSVPDIDHAHLLCLRNGKVNGE